jgi:hypothetical protein
MCCSKCETEYNWNIKIKSFDMIIEVDDNSVEIEYDPNDE